MYDPQSEPHEFIGETVAEAIAKACSFFGSDEAELTIRSLDTSAVSGLADRALVVAQPRSVADRPARRPRGDRRAEARPQKPSAAPASDEPSVGTARGQLGPVGEFVLGVVERMELGPFEIAESEDERFLVYQLTGPAAHALTAADGRVPDALQLLANQAAGRANENPKRVVVDTDGNREKREAFLSRVAERAAKRARDTGRSVALDPMNPKDRRGIHVALRDTEGVATMSIGEGRYRQVVVVPEGAPEYEEAKGYAADASDG